MSIAPHSGHDSQVVAPSTDQNLQGISVDASDPAALRQAIDLALHYRGDVTIVRKSDSPPAPAIEGYIFDCKTPRGGEEMGGAGEMLVRIIPTGRDERIAVPFSDIARLTFSGRDTASGKSFETWVKKYVQNKMAGESASIEAESLD